MSHSIQVKFLPEQAVAPGFIIDWLNRNTGFRDIHHFEWRKRSIDARKKTVWITGTIEYYREGQQPETEVLFTAKDVKNAPEVCIVGSGPAGLFAALQAITLGLKPVIFERGKDVRSRRRDLAALNKQGLVDPNSNYCFGEGGAGTYSDGKLYTRSKKRGDVMQVLRWLVHFGASNDILVDSHPHIGTNKLPKLITSIRETIIKAGGEIHFETLMTDIFVEDGILIGIELNHKKKYNCRHLILATGHSARDVFYLLHKRKIGLKAKPFALGVRVEHAQELIDRIQYHGRVSDEFLPPASYQLVTQVENRGVYSFCMCPGGIIAPCATQPGEVVTNGWSPSKRNNPYANSGIVVSIEPHDLQEYTPDNPFICLDFQSKVERDCHQVAGGLQQVPAQRLLDFVQGRKSADFPRSSYQPGITSVDLNQVLPPIISRRLKQAFVDFGKKMQGYLTNDAVIHAPESRTSSPVQIPRNPETLMHPDVAGLYPCGEGAGYAGGIVSAAIDGMKCMAAVYQTIA